MTGDGFSSRNSPSSLHTLTAPDKAYDDHIRDPVISRTNPGYSHRVHVTAVIPQVRGLLPYYRSRESRDSSSPRTTSVLSEPGSRVIPTKPPRLPYDDPRESVQSG
ncbi:UNVERIFIED_CONTAM: hypothetical protein Slati_1705600 [Sesamum latifolium]|uniref:Uncharacterized protein n=1 Tax=Sesamum latifolium TaxID=2727402 RepID=A0AAW2WVH7_9LAMI